MDGASRRRTIRILRDTTIGAVVAVLIALRWMHSKSPDAALWAKIWFGLCALSVISGLVRFFYYRNRLDYFAEEMDHRRSLAKGSFKARS